ncbi:AcrR family transcriptional regulator [Actinoalloteichus hoggarensis]|uniref:Transcriptional regulator, TetR family n=1 Tax=Actinoalloteichus hoggarensis TaxID=1470176 RepID=A0A221WBJ0_9PSEU|nr:TetR/AcrR family transcriptional regulator [Actinoalloteichus hoggarensis]ASO22647.1 Transcriptional regulator, TetR family [Actinoalloteichus hoggarensis]MBB5924211.1 AcrR family transcriptional regulator [Actinoalloteichus hoggarensis]
MARPRIHDEQLRLRLLDRAAELISTHGIDGLSLRRLAADAGTSTTAVYSLFGSKAAVLRAVYIEAFQRLSRRLEAVARTDDPAGDLLELGMAYHGSALADPHLYAVMFQRSGSTALEADEVATEAATAAMRPLVETVERGIQGGLLADLPAHDIAYACWAMVHGLVSLELDGCLAAVNVSAGSCRAALAANIRGWLRTPAA